MTKALIGRQAESAILHKAMQSGEAEMVGMEGLFMSA